jgi:multisubunit Na+/H+ antiporter MnhG subunit
MDQPYNRISENVLFTLLLTALVGWLTAPVASDLLSASAAEAHHAGLAGVHRS